jgi:hypothetical protein
MGAVGNDAMVGGPCGNALSTSEEIKGVTNRLILSPTQAKKKTIYR